MTGKLTTEELYTIKVVDMDSDTHTYTNNDFQDTELLTAGNKQRQLKMKTQNEMIRKEKKPKTISVRTHALATVAPLLSTIMTTGHR